MLQSYAGRPEAEVQNTNQDKSNKFKQNTITTHTPIKQRHSLVLEITSSSGIPKS